MFFNIGKFPFAAALERNWRQIYDEYLGVRRELTDWYEKELYGEGWKVFGLFDFPHGEPLETNVRRCPFTASLVERRIRNHGAAGFSILRPSTRVRSHQGYPGNFLRCHLGLKIPAGDCALKVEEDVRSWQEGKVLIFDDRVPHEAWNLTGEERVVLLIDFIPD